MLYGEILRLTCVMFVCKWGAGAGLGGGRAHVCCNPEFFLNGGISLLQITPQSSLYRNMYYWIILQEKQNTCNL